MPVLDRYVILISAIGLAVLAAVLGTSGLDALVPASPEVWVVGLALIVGECLPMRVIHHGSEGEITTSSTFALALLIVAGPALTMVVMTLAAIAADLQQRKSVPRTLFNVGQYAIAVGGAHLALESFNDLGGSVGHFAADDLVGA